MKIYEKYLVNETRDLDRFLVVKRNLMDELRQYEQEYGKAKLDRLEKINDPKKWVKAYQKLRGLSQWDLEDELMRFF